MLYISRIRPGEAYYVMDTDDGVETQVSRADLANIVLNSGLHIKGVTVGRGSRGLFIEDVIVYSHDKGRHKVRTTVKRQPAKTAEEKCGVAIKVANGRVKSISVNKSWPEKVVTLRPADYAEGFDMSLIPKLNEHVLKIDFEGVKLFGAPRRSQTYIADVRGLDDASGIYWGMVYNLPYRAGGTYWDKYIVDSLERSRLWKAISLLSEDWTKYPDARRKFVEFGVDISTICELLRGDLLDITYNGFSYSCLNGLSYSDIKPIKNLYDGSLMTLQLDSITRKKRGEDGTAMKSISVISARGIKTCSRLFDWMLRSGDSEIYAFDSKVICLKNLFDNFKLPTWVYSEVVSGLCADAVRMWNDRKMVEEEYW